MPNSHLDLLYASTGGSIHPKPFPNDAGFDLEVAEETTLRPLGDGVFTPTDVPCGVKLALPGGTAGLIVGRSSAVRNGIIVVSTIIDQGYRGPMFVFAYNMTERPIKLYKGTSIAQIVPFCVPTMGVRETSLNLPDGDRKYAGFGSSGRVANG